MSNKKKTNLGYENEDLSFSGEKIERFIFYTDDKNKINELKIELANGRWIYIFPSSRDFDKLALKIE